MTNDIKTMLSIKNVSRLKRCLRKSSTLSIFVGCQLLEIFQLLWKFLKLFKIPLAFWTSKIQTKKFFHCFTFDLRWKILHILNLIRILELLKYGFFWTFWIKLKEHFNSSIVYDLMHIPFKTKNVRFKQFKFVHINLLACPCETQFDYGVDDEIEISGKIMLHFVLTKWLILQI